jgi:hypothetical protein
VIISSIAFVRYRRIGLRCIQQFQSSELQRQATLILISSCNNNDKGFLSACKQDLNSLFLNQKKMNLQSPLTRSIILAIVFFLPLTFIRIISDEKITVKTFTPGLISALVGGLVVYILLRYVFNRK